MKLNFRSTRSGFREKGPFFKISIFGHDTWPLAKVPEVAHTCLLSFYPKGSKWGIFSLYGQRFPRYGPIFKITLFRYETWPLTKYSEVAYMVSFYPRGLKLSLFLLYGQRFPRYGLIFKIAILGHETCELAKVPETAHTLSFYPRGSTPGGWKWAYSCSTDNSFRDTARFSKLPYLDMKLNLVTDKRFRNLHIYTLSTPGGMTLSLFSLCGQQFMRYGPLFKTAIFGHEAWLLTKLPEVAHILPKLPPESQISPPFALRSLAFQIIEVFGFSIAYSSEFEIFENKWLKIANSKFQQSAK